MAPVFKRHPRYALLLSLLLAGVLYTLYSSGSFNYKSSTLNLTPLRLEVKEYDTTLPSRVARADAIYDKALKDRHGLIKKFGPTPKDVALFPPDKRPWPPYTVWDFFPPSYNCPHEVRRIGALGDGGKYVCGLSRLATKKDCIIYSFGINLESSFEAELLANTDHCEVWGYDFSVPSFGPEILPQDKSRTHFHAFGLGGTDKHGPGDNPPMYTLDSLLKMNGHTHIDILKIDIEGWEFETLTTLIKPYLETSTPLPFAQLQLEIHLWNKSFEEFLKWWEMLEEAGLRPFMTEPNLVYQNYNKGGTSDLAEYSFLNRKGRNAFLHESSAA